MCVCVCVCVVGAYVPYCLSLLITRVNPLQTAVEAVALMIDLVYVCQEGSREQVLLDVRLIQSASITIQKIQAPQRVRGV